MVRKGYSAEYKCKLENEETYGKGNCIKVAIGGSSDFLIAFKGKLIKFIEVKETKKERYYPSPRERKQFASLVRLGKHHQIPVELWIYFKQGRGKPTVKHVRRIYEQTKIKEESSGNIKVARGESSPVNEQREIHPSEIPN